MNNPMKHADKADDGPLKSSVQDILIRKKPSNCKH